jgi:hypothetical protein
VALTASAKVDVRVRTGEDARRVEAAIRARPSAEDASLRVIGTFGRPPMARTARNHALWLAAKRIGGELGLSLDEAGVGGVSDGNLTSLYTATLDGLGPVGDGAHAEHEHVEISRLPERAALLALLLLAPVELAEPADAEAQAAVSHGPLRLCQRHARRQTGPRVRRRALPQASWSTGDFVVGRVLDAHRGIEKLGGPDTAAVAAGDLVRRSRSRAATLQAAGDWRAIGADGRFEDRQARRRVPAGARRSATLGPLTKLVYEGHVVVDDERATMTRWIADLPARRLSTPSVLIIGTSMDAARRRRRAASTAWRAACASAGQLTGVAGTGFRR